MPSLTQLLNNVPKPRPTEQASGDLMSTLADVGGAGLGAVASVGNFLDLPGSSIRDLLAGQNPLDQWLSPLSDVNRTSGRQLLETYGMRANKETGLMGWLSDPGEGLRDMAGFGAEVLFDPFGPAAKALMGTKALAPAVTLAGRAHPAVKAVGRGAKYIFDTLPEKMTAPILDRVSNVGSSLWSLFNKQSEGITDASIMPFAETARATADEWRNKAGIHLSELVTTSNNNGFNLVADDTLDLTNPENLLKDNSLFKVRNREDQIRRAFEGVYDPTDTGLRPKDLVTVGSSDVPREVEFLNNTPTGTQVKLAGDDTLHNLQDIKPHYMSAQEPIPQPVLDTIQRIKQDSDAVRLRLKNMGYDTGTLIDPYVEFAHRRKSNELRQAEQIGGANIPDWIRKNNKALTDALAVPGSRELVYRAFKEGTTGANTLYNDPGFQKIVETIDSLSTPSVNDGLTTSVMPDYIGQKHVADLAASLDRTPEDFWDELVQTRQVNKTGTVAYTAQPGVYDVVSGGQGVGQFGVRMIDDIAEISTGSGAAFNYRTEKGSTYQHFADGTTVRNKAPRNDPGHEGDFGPKPKSAKTLYVDKDASALSAAGMSNFGEARVVIRDGKASLVTKRAGDTRWGVAPSSRDIPVYTDPAVGRQPLELWSPKDDVPGYEAYGNMHAGNKIVNMSPGSPMPPDAFDDAMQYVEFDLASKGTSRVDVRVTPEIADVLKKRGYEGSQIVEDPYGGFAPAEPFNDTRYGLVSATERGGTVPVYHASKQKFSAFDDSRLTSNSAQAQGMYSADSALGHQFVPDPTALENYPNRSALLGDVIHATEMKAGRTAVIDVYALRSKLQTPAEVAEFKKYLQSNGFESVRLIGGGAGKLTDNTLVALSSDNLRVTSHMTPAEAVQHSKTVKPTMEVWSKPLYQAGKMVVDHPQMLSKTEFKDLLQKWYDWQVTQVKDGNAKGFQPGRGWWKSWTDLRPGQNGEERILNFDAKDFQQIDINTLDAMRPVLPNVEDYDIARAALEAGKEVHIGKRVMKRGKPAEFVMITPTVKAQVEGRFKKLMDGLDESVSKDPLTSKEAIYDSLHRAIGRNYGDKVDQWMPKLGERGVVTAVSAAGEAHAASINEWHKLFDQTLERGENFTGPMRALLRLDDVSLKALLFKDEQIEQLKNLRTDLPQDVTIELVDRHRALALDMGDKVERRYLPMYSRSAGADQFDYLSRNGAAVAVLDNTRRYIAGAVKEGLRGGNIEVGKLTNDLDIKYDPAAKRGLTMAQAIDQGFFPEKLNKNVFIDSVRQELIADGTFREIDDAAEITRQLNTVKSVRLNAETWSQLKTFNEGFTGELPELNPMLRAAGSLTAATKAGLLSISPATAIRDGGSSMVNAYLMGGMNPVTAIGRFGKKAMSFIRGASVDPGEGIQEIEDYLIARSLPSNPKTRGEAFQNMWNSYTMSGSLHPNVVTADAARMAETELTSDMVGKGATPQEFMEGLKRTILKPWKALDPRVPGTWTKDSLDRVVQRSKSENPLVDVNNNLRGMIDGFVRSMYVMDRATKTKSLKDAFAAADKFLLNADPTKFTRFENKYMKTLIPFYSFMRQSLPLFMGEMLVNPGGKLGQTIRATRLGQGGSDEYVPYQYLDSAAIPLGQTDDGTLRYLTSFGLMHEDAVKYAGNVLQGDIRALQQQVTASASPLIKWWIEHSTNTSLFSQGPMGGRRLDDLDPTIGRILSNVGLQDVDASGRAQPFLSSPLLESLAAAGPASRVLSIGKTATDQRSNAVDKVMRLLSGVRTEYVTQEMVTRDLRDRLNAIQIAAGARPLTTVSGTSKLQEHLAVQGDTEKVAVLQRIEEALAIQRKLVRDKEKMKSKPLIDMLQQVQ